MASVPKSNRATHYVIWGVALFLVVLAIYAVRSLTLERVAVNISQATYQDLEKRISTTGKVEPDDDFQAHAQAAGQVRDIYVRVGEKVKAGQLLLRMDDKYALANLAHARSTLQAAETEASDIQHGGTQDERNTTAANLRKAQLQLQRDQADLTATQKLLQQGAAAPAEVAAAEQRIQLDNTNIRSIQQHSTERYSDTDRARAQAQIADARAAVAAAQRTYDTADIRSEIAGTVYYLPVAQYDYVDTGTDLVYVANLSRLRITAYFDEPDIGNLAVGQPVKITWEAKPGLAWYGHVEQVPTTIIEYQTRFVGECFISIDDADGALDPNANVNVTVTTAQRHHVLSVPREAMHTDNAGNFVFRVVNGRLIRTPVQVGIFNLNREEILSGLSEGDVVAVNATTPHELSNGLEVKTVP